MSLLRTVVSSIGNFGEEVKTVSKKKIIVIVAIIGVMGLIGAIIEGTQPSMKSQTSEQIQAKNEPSPTSVEKYNLQVTSQIVKKVDGKYRYFFSIKNDSDKDFAGTVDIKGKTGAGITVISKYLDYSDQPLKAGLSQSVYSDANTAPKSVFGENGASTFTFTAMVSDNKVAKGEGMIADKIEEISDN